MTPDKAVVTYVLEINNTYQSAIMQASAKAASCSGQLPPPSMMQSTEQ